MDLCCFGSRLFFLSIIHNGYGFERILFTIFKLAIKIKLGELVISKLAIFTVAEEDNFLTGHAVEFDVDSFSVVLFGVKNH